MKKKDQEEATSTTPEPRAPALYKQVELLAPERHAKYSVKTIVGFKFASNLNSVVVSGPELEQAQHDYPIVFTQEDPLVPMAILGLKEGENRFIGSDGLWRRGSYVPAYVRRYPFIFVQTGEDQLTLGADLGSEHFVESDVQPLFLDSKPAPILQQAMEFCRAYQAQYLMTVEFGKALREHGVLEAKGITINRPEATPINVGGFQLVNPQKLRELPAEVAADWNKRGWLSWAYYAAASYNCWSRLASM